MKLILLLTFSSLTLISCGCTDESYWSGVGSNLDICYDRNAHFDMSKYDEGECVQIKKTGERRVVECQLLEKCRMHLEIKKGDEE